MKMKSLNFVYSDHGQMQYCKLAVADLGCLSRIMDPDPTIFWYPGSRNQIQIRPSFILDPGSGSYK
jgi:hypothetical protein